MSRLSKENTQVLWNKMKSYINSRLGNVGSVATEDVVPVSKGGTGQTTIPNTLKSMFPSAMATGSVALLGTGWDNNGYIPLSNLRSAIGAFPTTGGTISGNLTVGSAIIYASNGQTTGLKVNRLYHYGDDVEVAIIHKNDSWYSLSPATDSSSGAKSLGSSNYRWKQLYASTTTINTSDRNQKRDINDLDDKYIQLFDLIRPTSYYLKNGDRIHTGFIAQEVEDAMTKVGLTAKELGFFCRDIKTEPVQDENGEYIEDKKVYDEDGNPVYIYGLRYSEYIAIMAAKIKKLEEKYDEKLKELDAKLAELDAKLG